MAWAKIAITLVSITNTRTASDPGPDLEIYGDLYVRKIMNDGTGKIIEQWHMWHRNSTDRIVLNQGDSLFVNNRQEVLFFSNQLLVFDGTSMFEHDTWPNPDDTFIDGTNSLFFSSIKNEDISVNFLEYQDNDLIPTRDREQFFANYKIEVLRRGLGRVPQDVLDSF